MKAKHPEAILLSRVGDFYEAYGEDAETIARALQIALTSKEAGGGKRVAMAGVPHHALAAVSGPAGAAAIHRRACRAVGGAAAQRLVRRDVVRLVTPGTLIEEQLLDGKQNNYLAAVAAIGGTFALAYADVSTSYTAATAIAGEEGYDELLAELGAHRSGRDRRRRGRRSARNPRHRRGCDRGAACDSADRLGRGPRAAAPSTAFRSKSRWRFIARSKRSTASSGGRASPTASGGRSNHTSTAGVSFSRSIPQRESIWS